MSMWERFWKLAGRVPLGTRGAQYKSAPPVR